MEVSATLKQAHISAQKARLVADQVRGLPVEKALNLLMFSPKKAAVMVRKVLESAIANAARAKGRGTRILKRNSHITVTVGDV